QREQVTTEAAPVGRDDAEREVGGDDRVDGVPAVGEHAEAGRRRAVVRRRDRGVGERSGALVDHSPRLLGAEALGRGQPVVWVKLNVSDGSGGALSNTLKPWPTGAPGTEMWGD